jgi:hypothetical protein
LPGAWKLALLFGALLGIWCVPSHAAFVYETPSEFVTSGDFDGDGRADAVVFDKLTGNVRVGYQNTNGSLDWSAARASGSDGASALAVGRFAETNRDSIAVTATALNQIRVLNLSNPSNSPAPTVINPTHAGTSLLVGLDAPYGTNWDHTWLTAGAHDPGITLLDLLAFIADGSAAFQDQIVDEGYLASGNPLTLGTNKTTFVAGMLRGNSNDTFVASSYASQSNVLYRVGLAPGTEYTPGHFQWSRDTNAVSVLLFYVPGQSNLIAQRIIATAGGYTFDTPTTSTFASAIQQVFFVDEGTNGLAVIRFGDGVVGARPTGTNDGFQTGISFGNGAAGNVASGVIPLGPGKFALLTSASNALASTGAQIFTQSGTNYVQTSSNALPAATSVATRGNVWLFQIEPFASTAASLVGSLSAPAWSSTITGLPGTLAVRVESDGGITTGLNNPATNNFGPPPAGTVYVLPNQYRDDISFFSYGPARPTNVSVVTISPPPGSYAGPIQISFTTQNAADSVQYRATTNGVWQSYTAPFLLTNDATIQFYGQSAGGARGQTQSADYALNNIAVPAEPLATLPGSDTNPPPVNPSIPHISASGTVFYGRRGSNTVPSIWAINLDGSGETLITTGREPRVSRDGRWLAFWRENDPLTNQFSLWLRDLPAGQENRWTTHSNRFVGFDWQNDNTNLIFAADGLFWRIGLNTAEVAFPLSVDTRQGAPAVNPVDGRVALQVIYPGSTGLYLAPSNVTSRQNLGLNILSPRWPAWSPDGTRLAIADDPNISQVLDAGHNLWVVTLGAQTNIYQITALAGSTNGFPNGAVWAPGGNKLVTAGSIGGVNGLWVIPVSSDGSACHCQPQLLPTSPGDPIDFAGSVLTTAHGSSAIYANLGLFIRLDPAVMVVYWSTNYDGFTLESATEVPMGLSWTSVTGPYFRAGPYFEYREARTTLAAQKYFRLHYPGVLVLTPPEPALAFHVEPDAAVLNWPLNYVGYTVEATTNLSPPALWIPLPGGAVNTNGVFEYRRVLPGPAQEFYRLRGP